ncbi:unnamed protein product [Pedinophyceae sp. YPF-701]|nr:unnamed protein product [Pedinophyceae sp. YPF-701]
MPAPSAPAGARFVCVPSDEVSLSFKTVRAQPRPANAVPEMETLLNVPTSDLEELLVTAIEHVEDICKGTCPPSSANIAFFHTRIEAESTTRTRDIQAVTTYIPGLARGPSKRRVLAEVCRRLSTDGRTLECDANGRVVATVEVDGGPCGPVDCTPVVEKDSLGPEEAASGGVFAVDTVMSAARGMGGDDVANCLMQLVRLDHDGEEIPQNAMIGGSWFPSQPGTIMLGIEMSHFRPSSLQAFHAMGTARSTAQLFVRGLRGAQNELRELCEGALVIPDPWGKAALLESAEQDWTGGKFPAVALNVMHVSTRPDMPVVYLTLPAGMAWKPALTCDDGYKFGTRMTRLGARIVDRDAFGRPQPVTPTWRACVDKLEDYRGCIERAGLSNDQEWRTKLMRCVVAGYEKCMASPEAMVGVDAEIERLIRAAFGSGFEIQKHDTIRTTDTSPAAGVEAGLGQLDLSAAACSAEPAHGERQPAGPRFVCAPSDMISLSFVTARAEPRPEEAEPRMETFLNMPEDQLEEALRVALHRACKFATKHAKLSRAAGTVDGDTTVLTRIEAECSTKTRDLKIVTGITNSEGPAVNAFCRELSGNGRKMSTAPDRRGKWRVRATVDVDGAACGPLDVTDLVDLERFLQHLNVSEAAFIAHNNVVDDVVDKTATYCFYEVVHVRHEGQDCGDVAVKGVLSKQYPNKIMVMWDHADVRGSTTIAQRFAAMIDDVGPGRFTAHILVAALRRPRALPALSADALLAVPGPAWRAPQAWDEQGRFPAISINVVVGWHDVDPTIPCVSLELPRGMRWRAVPSKLQGSGLTRVVAEIANAYELGKALFHHAFPMLAWSTVVEGAAGFRAKLQGMSNLNDDRPTLTAIQQKCLDEFAKEFWTTSGDGDFYVPGQDAPGTLASAPPIEGERTDGAGDRGGERAQQPDGGGQRGGRCGGKKNKNKKKRHNRKK